MARGTADDVYLETLKIALQRTKVFGADVVIIALGMDAFFGDPFKGFAFTETGLGRIGVEIAKAGLPCLSVQKGGDLCDELSANLAAVLNGIERNIA